MMMCHPPLPVSPQGDFPWDEKDFRYLAVTAAGVSSALLYFYFRDNGREISWKDFVHRYVSRGVVRSSEHLGQLMSLHLLKTFSSVRKVCQIKKSLFKEKCVSVQVDRLEVVNKQYVRVILVPGADADVVRGNDSTKTSNCT